MIGDKYLIVCLHHTSYDLLFGTLYYAILLTTEKENDIIFKLRSKIIFCLSLTSYTVEHFISTWYQAQEKKTASVLFCQWLNSPLFDKSLELTGFLASSCVVELWKSLIVILFKEKENVFWIKINQNSWRLREICWLVLSPGRAGVPDGLRTDRTLCLIKTNLSIDQLVRS